MESFQGVKSFRVPYEQFTPNPSNPFNLSVHSIHSIHSEHSEHSNHSERVKHFKPLGLSHKLKEIDFNALECVER